MSGDRSKPDLTFVNLIHRALPADGARLAAAIAALPATERTTRLPGIRAFFGQYRDQLVMHHRHEDELFFRALAARTGAGKMQLHELDSQHQALDTAIHTAQDRLAELANPAGDFAADHANATRALSAMTELLNAHLTREEETALPLFETHMPAPEYKRLEARARKTTPRPLARFLVPWIITHATHAQRKALYKSAPPLRLVYRLNLRHYRRFDQALTPAPERSG
jgi:iron-sulfur cluster repair protein YtfE (RIC family)